MSRMTDLEAKEILKAFSRRNEKLGVDTRDQDVQQVLRISDALRVAGTVYELISSGYLDIELSASKDELLFTFSDQGKRAIEATKERVEKPQSKGKVNGDHPEPITPDSGRRGNKKTD